MIKSTYYNLPEEKRKRILTEVTEEFCLYKPEKISINSIIKKAGISRGSFYQYFDDKGDLALLVIDFIMEKLSNLFKKEIEICRGDIFQVTMRIFDTISGNSKLYRGKGKLKNMFDNIKAYEYRINAAVKDHSIFQRHIPDFKKIDLSKFKFKKKEEIMSFLDILLQLLRAAVFAVAAHDMDSEGIRKDLEFKLRILKEGALIDA